MSDVVQTVPPPAGGEQAGYEADLGLLLAEAERLNEMMRADRAEIERLKSETWALRAETRALLAGMGARL